MKRSTDRILTTHVGSLPRPSALLEAIQARAAGQSVDAAAVETGARAAVSEVIEKQTTAGIDVIDDGEQGKPGFTNYVNERLTGFELKPATGPVGGWLHTREGKSFPAFYGQRGAAGAQMQQVCTGPITYRGQAAVQADIQRFKAALQGAKYEEAFLPAISPTNVEGNRRNEYYKTEDEYLQAIADAMHEEYQAIFDAGLLVQVDDPRLSTYYNQMPDLSVEECRKWAFKRVEVVNHALRGIPAERVRFHTCYSIDIGPRVNDMPIKDIADVFLGVNAGAYSFEYSNPRHEHEHHFWEGMKLPEGKILIPGMISHASFLVEHPELVAERIVRFASIVGRENVIAGADCGFAAVPRPGGGQDIHPEIVWAKFQSLAEGARIASRKLWNRS